MIEIDEVYLHEELVLTQAKLILENTTITIEMNQKTVRYQNDYTAFSFNDDTNELEAPHFSLTIKTKKDAKKLSDWLMGLTI